MGNTTTNRHRDRDRLFKRLNAGTDRLARRHQRVEAQLLAQATVEFRPDFAERPEACPHCGGTEITVEDIMHATIVGGELIYWRCAGCGKIFSRLTHEVQR